MREVRKEIAVNRKAGRVLPACTFVRLRIGKRSLDTFETIGVVSFVEVAVMRFNALRVLYTRVLRGRGITFLRDPCSKFGFLHQCFLKTF